MALLELDRVSVGYAAVPVLHDIDLRVEEGSTTVVLGRTGSGRTALASTITGVLSPWVGTVTFAGDDVTGAGVEDMVRRGVVLAPQGRRVFGNLSVADHLAVGAWSRRSDPAFVVEEQAQRCYRSFPRLAEAGQRLVGTLPAVEQQMVSLCRALMARPRVLVVDEPSCGLAAGEWREVLDALGRLAEDGTTIVLCEQNPAALQFADRAVLLRRGEVTHDESAGDLRGSADLRRELLGAG